MPTMPQMTVITEKARTTCGLYSACACDRLILDSPDGLCSVVPMRPSIPPIIEGESALPAPPEARRLRARYFSVCAEEHRAASDSRIGVVPDRVAVDAQHSFRLAEQRLDRLLGNSAL